MRIGQRITSATTAALLLGVLVAGSASAQVSADAVSQELTRGVYVQPGAESVDTAGLAVARAAAAAEDIDLNVVVLADVVDAVAFAQELNDRVSGTILVFTPESYGASSSELSQGRMNDALGDAADTLAGDDIVAGVAAFVDAASPSSRRWGILIAAAILIMIVVGVGGRLFERRATTGRRAEALAGRWEELKQRSDAMSDTVLQLSTRVELDGRPEMAERFRAVGSRYGELAHELDRGPNAKRVDNVDAGLSNLEQMLELLEADLAERS